MLKITKLHTRQNEKLPLEYQALARYKLNQSECCKRINWLLIIVFILLGNFANMLNHSAKYQAIVNFILILWFFSSMFLNKYIERIVCESAQYKKVFDYYVFGWRDNIPPLSIKEISIISKNESWFNEQIKYSGKDDNLGVRDWYENFNSDNDYENIKNAMQDNIYYDYKLNKKAIKIFVSLFILVVIILILALPVFTLDKLFADLFIIYAPLLQNIVELLHNSIEINKINEEIDLQINFFKNISDLKDLNDLFYEKRKIVKLNTNYLHKKTKERK